MTIDETRLLAHRNEANQAAVILIHGFNGNTAENTWGHLPEFLCNNRSLDGWDIFCLGYATKLRLDFIGLWAADPDIPKLSCYLHTACSTPPLKKYQCLALVAHSMGGLVVQRALVDFDDLASVVSHVFLFGTPSAGLRKANPFRWLKQQVRDMSYKGPFISDLRKRWQQKYSLSSGKNPPFKFWAVAGDRDEFVPASSSIAPFAEGFSQTEIAVVPGNHLEIVKPVAMENMTVQLLLSGLQGKAGVAGPWNSAAVAVESRNFLKAIALLEPHKDELDPDAVVQLALAMESVGRTTDALQLLEKHHESCTDAMGVLAGRLKRRWLVNRRSEDARRARGLYENAYRLSENAGDHAQAYYHGINIAFIDLSYGTNRTEAKRNAGEMAKKVLQHCAQTEPGKWRYATEGEAWLILDEYARALDRYRQYIRMSPGPRELESTFLQAKQIADLIGNRIISAQLDSIFSGSEEKQ